MAMAEIEVIGGGAFGLAVAFCLQQRGAKVRLYEKRRIGAGSSGGVVGALAPHTPDNWNDKKRFQYESLIATESFMAEADRLSGVASGYGQVGRLMPIVTEREMELAQERVISARHFWQGNADWNVVPSGTFPGWEPASPTGFLVYETMSARMSPARTCQSLAGAFQALGGEIVLGKTHGPGADATVICTGYEGLLDLSRELGAELGKGVKGQGVSLEYDARDMPQIFAQGVHIIGHADGTVAVGSTSEIDWSGADQVDEQLDELLNKALEICPPLKGAPVLRRFAGVRPRGRRRAPMLGPHPTRDRVFIANGGFKIGFGVVVKVGQVMADLVLDGAADIPDNFTVAANLP